MKMTTLADPRLDFGDTVIPPLNPAYLVPRPAHVRDDQVFPFPYILGATTKQPPHRFVPEIQAKAPEVFWADRVYNGSQGAWVPRTVPLLQQVYSDNVHFVARDFAPFSKLLGEDWFLVPAEADPPLHATLRSMVNPVFTPKRMAALEEKIRRYAREYILAFRDRGRCDFMAEFAFEFPIKVFLELMGLPEERTAEFLLWEHKLLHEGDLNEVIAGTRAVVDYLRGEIADRRANPRDDLISYGVTLDHKGRKLTEDELLGFCFNLFIGGLDTVSTNMAWQFLHLAQNPDDQRRLRENPELIPDAIDECMRRYAAVATSRECVQETQLGDVTVKPGDKVLLATFLAGQDATAYPDPGHVDFDRKPRHVAFGFGPHLCIGMHLARREMRIAIEEFLELVPEFRIPAGTEINYFLASIVQPMEFPIEWDVS
jgi:cytochrome P450